MSRQPNNFAGDVSPGTGENMNRSAIWPDPPHASPGILCFVLRLFSRLRERAAHVAEHDVHGRCDVLNAAMSDRAIKEHSSAFRPDPDHVHR